MYYIIPSHAKVTIPVVNTKIAPEFSFLSSQNLSPFSLETFGNSQVRIFLKHSNSRFGVFQSKLLTSRQGSFHTAVSALRQWDWNQLFSASLTSCGVNPEVYRWNYRRRCQSDPFLMINVQKNLASSNWYYKRTWQPKRCLLNGNPSCPD